MTKSTITRDELNEVIATYGKHHIAHRMANALLAAMDSEPVIVVGDDGGDALSYRRLIQSFAPGTKLYRHAQPAPERDQVRREHAEWSQATFGDVGPVGPLKHLSKEALEAAAEPGDLSEWADIQFLLWDAQRRAGISDEQITQAMIEKLAVNKQREWPEPKDGEPRLHIKAQPAPVVNGEYGDAYQGAREDLAIWKRRALEAEESFRRLEQINDHLVKEAQGESGMGEPVIAQPAPVVPDGYVMVPMRLTAENGAKGALSGEFSETKFVNCPECFGDDECETCDGSGRIEITVPVTWTTIKEIWAKGVEHFSATPREVKGE